MKPPGGKMGYQTLSTKRGQAAQPPGGAMGYKNLGAPRGQRIKPLGGGMGYIKSWAPQGPKARSRHAAGWVTAKIGRPMGPMNQAAGRRDGLQQESGAPRAQ